MVEYFEPWEDWIDKLADEYRSSLSQVRLGMAIVEDAEALADGLNVYRRYAPYPHQEVVSELEQTIATMRRSVHKAMQSDQ